MNKFSVFRTGVCTEFVDTLCGVDIVEVAGVGYHGGLHWNTRSCIAKHDTWDGVFLIPVEDLDDFLHICSQLERGVPFAEIYQQRGFDVDTSTR